MPSNTTSGQLFRHACAPDLAEVCDGAGHRHWGTSPKPRMGVFDPESVLVLAQHHRARTAAAITAPFRVGHPTPPARIDYP